MDMPPNSSPSAIPSTTAASPLAEIDDCWNRIGVSGDASCPQLCSVIHCRNCETYAAAGVRILERVPPGNYRREWTEHISQAKKPAAPGHEAVVIFRLGAEWFALAASRFQEIIEQRRIHSVPHRRNHIVLGVINVRGELRVCISLARLLGVPDAVPAAAAKNLPRLVVAEYDGEIITFPVDEVHGVEHVRREELQAASGDRSRLSSGLLPWQDRFVTVLDSARLFPTINASLL